MPPSPKTRPISVLISLFLSASTLLGAAPALGQTEELRPPTPRGSELTLEVVKARPAGQIAPREAAVAPPLSPQKLEVVGGQVTPKAVLLGENFEGTFPGNTWSVLAAAGTNVGWGKSSYRKSQGGFSAWCAQAGSASPGAGNPVPLNMETWMVSNPYNLSSASSGTLSFDLWLQTEEDYDFFYVGASLDGNNFNLLGRSVDTNGFERFSLDLRNWGSLGDLTRKPAVWFAFVYESDVSNAFEGAYVDQVVLDVATGSGLNLLINQIDPADCPTVRAFVSVSDGAGNPIAGLQTSSFTVNENGAPPSGVVSQPATGSGEALAVSLVLDRSSSLTNADVGNIKVAAKAFVDLLQPVDRAAVYHFGSDVSLVQDYTTNKALAKAAVDLLVNSGLTALYDAIVEAAQHSTAVGGRRALVVMTDGADTASSATEQQAIQAAIAAGVPVFTIGFGNVDQGVLQRIAAQTGGLFVLGGSSGDLQTIFGRIANTLGSQYLLTWSAGSSTGGTLPVSITVNHQGQSATKTATYSQAGTACAGGSGPCTAGPTTLCLNRGRFKVEVSWTDFNNQSGPARVTACGSDDSGIFYFFTPDNWEMLIKVLDACGVNQRYWVYAAATTNVAYTINVTDTRTGVRKVYSNPLGISAAAITDSSAFATCP